MGVHGCGAGGVNGTDGGVEALPSGRQGTSTMPGRVCEDVYPPIRCAGEFAHGGPCSAEQVLVQITDVVHSRVWMSMH